ncbi:MAG TPA: discoidin domain-containing protein, partial [Bacteroides thetaiotaomicron]|nr:discoidin domain-containing protein [Bacteroides thetaiotaomicron]
INLSAKNLLIKAGSTASEPITLSITDWKYLENTKEALEYTLKIKIADIESTSAEVTNAAYYQEIVLKISKTAEKKKESVLLTNVKDWIFTFMTGVENSASNSVAGTGTNDVATNGVPFWLTVDFKEVKNVTGVQTTHWGAGYAPSKVEIFSSENGDDWVSIGQWDTKGRTQTITFDERVKTRYLKYQMITVPSRVDITRFYIYAW